MKLLTIMGSPRKKGKTAAALAMLEDNLRMKGHEIERINVTDYKINGCLGCYSCTTKAEELGCVQKDDAEGILKKILLADVVVYASPVYCFDFTAQLKLLIDRHFCLLYKPFLDGKRVALLLTCAEDEEHNADLPKEAFRRFFDGEWGGPHAELLGEYVIDQSGDPDFEGRAQETAAKMAKAILREV